MHFSDLEMAAQYDWAPIGLGRPLYFAAVVSIFFSWPPCVTDADIIFSSCGFFYLSSSSFSSPNLSGQRLDVYHISTHGVALVQI